MGDILFEILKNIECMDLLPKELADSIPPLYSQESEKDPVCRARYFSLLSNWDWYPIEYDPKEQLFFGFVHGFENELGYFSLEELKSLGANIERDLHFEPVPLSVIKAQHE